MASTQFLDILGTEEAYQLLKGVEKDTGEKHLPPSRKGKSTPGSWVFQTGISLQVHPQESTPCLMSLFSFIISLISSWMMETSLQ